MSDIMAESIQSLLERLEALEAQRLQETVAKLADEVETLKDENKHLKKENEDRKGAIHYLQNKNDHLEKSIAKLSEEHQNTKANSRLLPPEIKQLQQKLSDTDQVIAEMIPDQWETSQKADEALRLIETTTGNPNSRSLGKKRKRDVVQMINQELLAEEDPEKDTKKRRLTEED
ncbi:Heat shock protein ssb1 [Pestalotiopsis sp. IQ-011]